LSAQYVDDLVTVKGDELSSKQVRVMQNTKHKYKTTSLTGYNWSDGVAKRAPLIMGNI